MKISVVALTIFACTAVAVAQNGKSQVQSPGNLSVSGPGSVEPSPAVPGNPSVDVIYAHILAPASAGGTPTYKLYRDQEAVGHELGSSVYARSHATIQVRFSHINTFYYQYVAEPTRQVSFYSSTMPTVLSPFLMGASIKQTGKPAPDPKTVDFATCLADLNNHIAAYESFSSFVTGLGNLLHKDIVPSKENKEIKQDVLNDLKTLLGDEQTPRIDEISFRKAQVTAGMVQIQKDLTAVLLAEPKDPSDEQKDLVRQAVSAAAALNNVAADLDTAQTILTQVYSAPDTILSPPIAIQADQVYISLGAIPITPGAGFLAAPPQDASKQDKTLVVTVTGDYGVDFSTGLVLTNPVSHDYYLGQSSKATPVIFDGGSPSPAFVPAAFIHYYRRPAPGQFSIGPAFGVGLSGSQFMFGGSIVRGGLQRFMLVGGLSINNVTELDGDKVGNAPLKSGSIQTKQRYLPGYFIGLTFNFGL